MYTDALGKCQEHKSHLLLEIENLKQQLSEGESEKLTIIESLRKKILHWKVSIICLDTDV